MASDDWYQPLQPPSVGPRRWPAVWVGGLCVLLPSGECDIFGLLLTLVFFCGICAHITNFTLATIFAHQFHLTINLSSLTQILCLFFFNNLQIAENKLTILEQV